MFALTLCISTPALASIQSGWVSILAWEAPALSPALFTSLSLAGSQLCVIPGHGL